MKGSSRFTKKKTSKIILQQKLKRKLSNSPSPNGSPKSPNETIKNPKQEEKKVKQSKEEVKKKEEDFSLHYSTDEETINNYKSTFNIENIEEFDEDMFNSSDSDYEKIIFEDEASDATTESDEEAKLVYTNEEEEEEEENLFNSDESDYAGNDIDMSGCENDENNNVNNSSLILEDEEIYQDSESDSEDEALYARDEKKLEDLKKRFPGRETQLQQLYRLFGSKNDYVPPIYISGGVGVGKTTSLLQLLSSLHHPYTYTNIAECFNSKLLFSNILLQVVKLPNPNRNNQNFANLNAKYFQVNKIADFVNRLEMLWNSDETLYIVLDSVEHLRDENFSVNSVSSDPWLYFLPSFLQLANLTKRNICCIMISRLIWVKVRSELCSIHPIEIYYSSYTQDEMIKILDLDCRSPQYFDVFQYLTRLIYRIFSQVTKDLNELRRLVAILFPRVIDGHQESEDKATLYQRIEPIVFQLSKHIYANDFSISEWEKRKTNKLNEITQNKSSLAVELPSRLKWLLIASYIASNNPSNLDVRYFGDSSGQRKKKGGAAKVSSHTSRFKLKKRYSMPSSFVLDRMLAIYFAIFEQVDSDLKCKPKRDCELYSQIKTLVSLNLLTKTGARGEIEGVKLRCNVSYDFIISIAESLKFDISRYLQDP